MAGGANNRLFGRRTATASALMDGIKSEAWLWIQAGACRLGCLLSSIFERKMAGGAKKKRVARSSKSKKKGGVQDAVSELTDDVLADILSRLPIKSLCHCKLVCRRWRNLISHPEHRKKLPQTLAGFFYGSYDRNRFPEWARHFINVSGAGHPLIEPSLSFLPVYERIDMVDSCNGLLLCRGWKSTHPVTMDYVVCNPATEKWVVVPESGFSSKVKYYEGHWQRSTKSLTFLYCSTIAALLDISEDIGVSMTLLAWVELYEAVC